MQESGGARAAAASQFTGRGRGAGPDIPCRRSRCGRRGSCSRCPRRALLDRHGCLARQGLSASPSASQAPAQLPGGQVGTGDGPRPVPHRSGVAARRTRTSGTVTASPPPTFGSARLTIVARSTRTCAPGRMPYWATIAGGHCHGRSARTRTGREPAFFADVVGIPGEPPSRTTAGRCWGRRRIRRPAGSPEEGAGTGQRCARAPCKVHGTETGRVSSARAVTRRPVPGRSRGSIGRTDSRHRRRAGGACHGMCLLGIDDDRAWCATADDDRAGGQAQLVERVRGDRS